MKTLHVPKSGSPAGVNLGAEIVPKSADFSSPTQKTLQILN